MSNADLASAQQHLSASLRHLARATRNSSTDDAVLAIMSTLADSYFALKIEVEKR